MAVTMTVAPTLSPANAAAPASPAAADAAPDQTTGFAGILRAAANRPAGAGNGARTGVADDSAAAKAEDAGELLVANAPADALAAVEMIAPWIVPLVPTGAAAAPASAVVAGAAADPRAELPVAAMQLGPLPNASTPVSAAAVASTPVTPLPVSSSPGVPTPIGAIPLAAADAGATAVALTPVAPRTVDSAPDDQSTLAAPPIASIPVAAAAADETVASKGKATVGENPGLPPVGGRVGHTPPVQAELRPATAATTPMVTSAHAEADRAGRDASALRAEAALALSPASIGSAAPSALREAPTIMQAVDSIVASPAWREDVAQKLTHFVSLRTTSAEIRLNPADLGPIGVTISYADDQARVMITAVQPATRDALEQALPYLKEMLAQQGITLGEAEVRDRREPAPQWADADPRRGYADRGDDAPAARADAAANSALGRTRAPRLIDTFA